jgi:hypothetical protein
VHQERLTLERHSAALCPDLALVGFEPNDAYPSEDPFDSVNQFHQPRNPQVGRRDIRTEAPPRFYFYRFLRSQVRIQRDRWQAARAGPPPQYYNWPPGSFADQNWEVLQEHFRAIQGFAERQKLRLVIVLFPTAYQAEHPEGLHPVQARVSAFLSSEGIEHIVMNDALRGRIAEVFSDSLHFTPRGHEFVAETLARELRDRRIVPGEAHPVLRACEPNPNQP